MRVKREVAVGVEVSRDQLGQTHGGQKTSSNAARKRLTEKRQNGQPRPKSVAGRGVGVARNGVKKEICEAVPREMLLN